MSHKKFIKKTLKRQGFGGDIIRAGLQAHGLDKSPEDIAQPPRTQSEIDTIKDLDRYLNAERRATITDLIGIDGMSDILAKAGHPVDLPAITTLVTEDIPTITSRHQAALRLAERGDSKGYNQQFSPLPAAIDAATTIAQEAYDAFSDIHRTGGDPNDSVSRGISVLRNLAEKLGHIRATIHSPDVAPVKGGSGRPRL